MICGVHVNVSFGRAMADWLAQNAPLQQGEDSFFLRLARNLYQDLPLLSVLFGASPVAANSETLAVSHRNGPSGYPVQGFGHGRHVVGMQVEDIPVMNAGAPF